MIKYLLKRWWVRALIVLAVCVVIEAIGLASHQPGVGALAVLIALGVWFLMYAHTTRPKRRRADGTLR